MLHLCAMSNTKQHTMNKVTNLPKRYSFEYMYKVDGCIFTLQQCGMNKKWHLTGYASKEAFDNFESFLDEASELKRHFTHFMKFTFNRTDWGI